MFTAPQPFATVRTAAGSAIGRHPLTVGLLLAILLSLQGMVGSPPLYAQATSLPNPDLPAACGLNIVLALDESSSLLPHEATVRASVRSLLEALADTGSSVALVEFNLDARQPLPAPAYHPVTSGPSGTLGAGGIFDTYLNHGYVPNGFTNWDAAFVQIEQINQANGAAPLVIFVTDSHPTVYTNQFGSIVGADDARAIAEAVESANLVKAQGSHIFVVGVGDIYSEAPLIAISGPDRYPDGESVFGRADYVRTDFPQLTTALRQIVFGLCGPSVTVTKYVDQGNGPAPAAGITFTGSVQISEANVPATSFVWQTPNPGGNTGSRSATTDADGTAQWQWTPGTLAIPQPWHSQFTLTEEAPLGYAFESASCTRRTLALTGGFTSSTFSFPALPATISVGPNDLITCEIENALVDLVLTKQANPPTVPESGAPVTFTFNLFNSGAQAVTVSSLIDDHFGDLNGQGTCVADGSIAVAPGNSYQCTFTTTIAGNRGTPHTNVATATVQNNSGVTRTATATATVTFRDAKPQAEVGRAVSPLTVNEPGGTISHALRITNTNLGESLTITELVDLPFGDVTTVAGAVQASDCAVPQVLAPAGQAGATYQCTFAVAISGNPGAVTDTLTVRGLDDESNVLQLTDRQSVEIKNIPPAVAFDLKLDPESMPERGGALQLTATMTNLLTHEPLDLTALTTNLTEFAQGIQSSCTGSQTVAPGASYSCSYAATVDLNAGDYNIVVTGTVSDDDGSVIRPVQSKELSITDVPSAIAVTMNADRTTLAEPGDDVNFTVLIANNSTVDTVTIESVIDDTYGDLAANCTAVLPVTLPPAVPLRCDFVGAVSGPVGSIQSNEVTVRGTDDDGKAVTDRDQEGIEITDVPARLEITQVASPANVPEPGGIVTVTTTIRNISPTDNVTIGKVETNEVDLMGIPQLRAAMANFIDISATCSPALPVDLPPSGTVICRFTKTVTGPIQQRHTSTVFVSGIDDENLPVEQSSREAIDIIDVPSSLRVTETSIPVSVPEAGAMVTFTVQVRNTSRVDTVTINELVSDRFGNLGPKCGEQLPITLVPDGVYSCTFAEYVSGDVDTLLRQQTSVVALDDDGQTVGDSTQSTIGVTDTPSSVKITQLASPTGVLEPGGVVSFTVIVENTSPVDTVTVEQVTDTLSGEIGASCTPQLPTALAPGAQLRCNFSRLVSGNAFASADSTITINGIDDDAVAVSDFDLIQVDVLDAAPQGNLTAAASPNEVLESGGMVTMTVSFVNQGPEVTTLLVLSNTIVGDLNGLGTCVLPQTLAADGGQYSCQYNTLIEGVAGEPPANIVHALLSDDEGNERLISDEADLFLVAVAPDLQHTKVDELLVDTFEDPADEGKVSPGDTLRYIIEVTNAGNGVGQQVILDDAPDPNSSLVVGSVTTTKGTVLLGNTAGNTAVTVLLGDLGIGEQTTVQFDVLVRFGTGTTLLRNQAFLSQGVVSGSDESTVSGSDDPNTPFLGDPTDTVVFIPPTGLEPGVEPVQEQHSLFLPLITR